MKNTIPGSRGDWRTVTVLISVIAAHGFLLAAAARPSWQAGLWGTHSWTFLSPGGRWGVVAAALILGGLVLRGPPFPSRPARMIGCALIGAPVFYLLRDRTHLLGDGRLWISLLGDTRPYHPNEPLAFFGAILSTLGLSRAGPAEIAARLEILSVVAGVAALALMLRLARELGSDDRGRWLCLGLLLSSGALQFGFGYVEAYSLLWVAVLLYLILCLRAVRGASSVVPCAAALGVAAAVHGVAMLFLPGLLLVLAFRRPPLRTVLLAGTMALPPVTLAYVVLPLLSKHSLAGAAGVAAGASATLDMIGGFGFFDRGPVAWLFAQVNYWGLMAPLAPGLVPAGLALARRVDRTTLFLAVCSLAAAAPVLVLNTNSWRGDAFDWDSFAVAATPVTALLAWLWAPRASGSGLMRPILAVSSSLAFLGPASFVALNADPGAAMSRFEALLGASGRSPRALSWGYEALAATCRDAGRMDEAAGYYDVALRHQPDNMRLVRIRAGVLSWAGRHRESADAYLRAALREPGYPRIWFNLGMELERAGSADSAEAAYRIALGREKASTEAMNRLARLLLRRPDAGPEARSLIRESLRLDPAQTNAREMKEILSRSGGDSVSFGR